MVFCLFFFFCQYSNVTGVIKVLYVDKDVWVFLFFSVEEGRQTTHLFISARLTACLVILTFLVCLQRTA